MDVAEFAPKEVRYIKLGTGGGWFDQALKDGTIPFGYVMVDHAACLAGDWDTVRQAIRDYGRSENIVSQGVREVRDFYELGEDTLWVTMAHGHFWWAFAELPVIPIENAADGTPGRFRRTKDGWHRQSLTGEPLAVGSLSSALTRTASYRMTICRVDRADYLLRRIRGEPEPLHAEAGVLQERMREVGLNMIRLLHWEEFETLVDLIFARNGWRRRGVLGKNQPDVDLVVDQPITNEVAWVQVKTGTRQSDLDDYLERFRRDGRYDRFFFVCHTSPAPLRLPEEGNLHLWAGEHLARAAIEAGLFDWLVERTR